VTTTAREDLWELASVIAFERLGLVPLRKVDGAYQPPGPELATMSAEDSRKAKRKYRKLWRRSLARDLKMFEKAPRRRQKDLWRFTGASVRGAWKCVEDPLEGNMFLIAAVEVGERPSWYARGYRWARVKCCNEYRRMLLSVAKEFALLDPQRNM
jgi:hypothetical protein